MHVCTRFGVLWEEALVYCAVLPVENLGWVILHSLLRLLHHLLRLLRRGLLLRLRLRLRLLRLLRLLLLLLLLLLRLLLLLLAELGVIVPSCVRPRERILAFDSLKTQLFENLIRLAVTSHVQSLHILVCVTQASCVPRNAMTHRISS